MQARVSAKSIDGITCEMKEMQAHYLFFIYDNYNYYK